MRRLFAPKHMQGSERGTPWAGTERPDAEVRGSPLDPLTREQRQAVRENNPVSKRRRRPIRNVEESLG
jgi:hypothetical protein